MKKYLLGEINLLYRSILHFRVEVTFSSLKKIGSSPRVSDTSDRIKFWKSDILR